MLTQKELDEASVKKNYRRGMNFREEYLGGTIFEDAEGYWYTNVSESEANENTVLVKVRYEDGLFIVRW